MRRYFISQYPTFGSYANPTKWKIEQSPYFYWWLALTKNYQYLKFCSDISVGKKSKTEKLKKLYEDFGDVRYEGDRYAALLSGGMPNLLVVKRRVLICLLSHRQK